VRYDKEPVVLSVSEGPQGLAQGFKILRFFARPADGGNRAQNDGKFFSINSHLTPALSCKEREL